MKNKNYEFPDEIFEIWKKVWDSALGKIFLVTFFLILGFGSVHVFKMENDNPIEQLAEEVIEMETGVNIDFTPNTGDK